MFLTQKNNQIFFFGGGMVRVKTPQSYKIINVDVVVSGSPGDGVGDRESEGGGGRSRQGGPAEHGRHDGLIRVDAQPKLLMTAQV